MPYLLFKRKLMWLLIESAYGTPSSIEINLVIIPHAILPTRNVFLLGQCNIEDNTIIQNPKDNIFCVHKFKENAFLHD